MMTMVNDDDDDDDDAIVIPERQYGYRTEPLEWSELQDIINASELAKLSRSMQQQQDYVVYLQELKKEWMSVYDYILVTKFGFQKRLVAAAAVDDDDDTASDTAAVDASSENNRKKDEQQEQQQQPTIMLWKAHPPLSSSSSSSSNDDSSAIRLSKNDFPYYFAPHIEHWCLWKLRDDVTEEEIEQAKVDLQQRNSDERIVDYLSWRNPPQLKSLPDIDHVHILCLVERRQKEEGCNDENDDAKK